MADLTHTEQLKVDEHEMQISLKEMAVDAQLEQISNHAELVARMNALDPPVTPEEEKKVRRKIDMRLPPFLTFLYFVTWLDRSALGNAALMGIDTDLNLSGAQFSLAVSIFFAGTCIADLFVNVGMRYIRPSFYLSGAMITWGVVTTLQAVSGGAGGLYATRFLLGLFEAVFISGAPYLTTVLYPRAEWGKRICVYLSATPLAGAFGGWIAYGVSHIKSSTLHPWQILFILEGVLTVVAGIACIWVLPDRPHSTKWLTPRERDVAVWRMLRDGNRTQGKVHWRATIQQFRDWRLCLNTAIFMSQVISTYTLATFIPTIVKTMGYDSVKAQLMVAPPYCVAFVMVFVVGWLSDYLGSCSGILVVNSIIAAIGDLMLVLVPESHHSVRYGATFLTITGILSGLTLSFGNITGNCCGDIKKAIAVGLSQALGSTMGVASGYIFPKKDGPEYKMGFWVLFSCTCFTGLAAAFVTFMNIRENRRRDRMRGAPPQNCVVDLEEDGLMEKHPHWRYYK